MRDSRFGRFLVTKNMIEHHPDVVRMVMSACIVVRCELLYAEDVFEYEALSPHFDLIGEGERIPLYMWRIDQEGLLSTCAISAQRQA